MAPRAHLLPLSLLLSSAQAVKDKVAVGRAQRAFRASRVAAESSARRDARFERRFASSERKGAALDRKLDANFAAVNRGMAGGFKAVCRNQADAGAALCDLAAVAAARAPCSTLAKICLRASLMNPEQIAAALAKSPVASKYVVSGQPLYGVTGGEVRLLLEDGALGAWGIAAEDIIEVQVALVWVLACCTMNANGVVVCTGAYG